MKRIIALLLFAPVLCCAEDITLTKSTVIRTERSMVSVKAGTVVELLSRDEKTITVRYNNITGTIPASSIAAAPETKKKDEPPAPPPPATSSEKGAQTNYGKAVQKAKENADKHDKNLVKPTDEVMPDK
jgi:hypothetical protein